MIPYIEIDAIRIGSFSLEPFGLLVVFGTTLGSAWGVRRSVADRVDTKRLNTSLYWVLGIGFLMSHVLEVVMYHPHRIATEGISTLFTVWTGMSSMGGFFGAFLGLVLYFRIIHRSPFLAEAELYLQGLIIAWTFGRLGCTIVHDHPGVHTDFIFAVQFPDGPRHDLGLYELVLNVVVLVPLVLYLNPRHPPKGIYILIACWIYAPARFFMDFLRAETGAQGDARYGGLTPAQYFCIVMVAIGGVMAYRVYQHWDEWGTPPGEQRVSLFG